MLRQGQGQGQGQDQKWRQRSALQLQMVLALTLTLVLVLTLALAPSGMISKKGVPTLFPIGKDSRGHWVSFSPPLPLAGAAKPRREFHFHSI